MWLLLSEADHGQLAALLGNGITAEWVRWSRGLPSWQQEAEHRKEERAGEVTGGREARRERECSRSIWEPTSEAASLSSPNSLS